MKSPPTHRLPLLSVVRAQAPVLRREDSSKGVHLRLSPVAASQAPTHLISSTRDQDMFMDQVYMSWYVASEQWQEP